MTSTNASQVQTRPSALEPPSVNASPIQSETAEYLSIIFEQLWGQLFPAQGSLLFDHNGQLILSTPKAQALCQKIKSQNLQNKLLPGKYENQTRTKENSPIPKSDVIFEMPLTITYLCDLMIDSSRKFPTEKLQLQEELLGDTDFHIQIRGEWIELTTASPRFILVTLEDLAQVAQQRSRCDAYRYQLTAREREVWALHLQGFTYRQISQRLYIALSTVKKHLKNVSSKRRGEIF
ncbi:MAG: LuxR C-terminal-related transcriptional regulator [Cyanobacteria bacterium J06627_28]